MKRYSLQFGAGKSASLAGMSPTFLFFVDMTNGATIAPPSITETLTGMGIYQFSWGTTNPIAFLVDAATTTPGVNGRYVAGQLDPADRADEYGTTLVAIGTSGIALGTTAVALGTTAVALGITTVALGTTTVALGTTSVALGTTTVALGITSVAYGVVNMGLGTTAVALGITAVAIGTSIYADIGSTPINGLIGGLGSTFGGSSTDPIDLFGYIKRIQEILEGNQNYTKGTGNWDIYSRGSSTLLRTKTIANGVSAVIKS